MIDTSRMIYYHHDERPHANNTIVATHELSLAKQAIVFTAPETIMPQLFAYGMDRVGVVATLRACADEIEGRISTTSDGLHYVDPCAS